MTGPQTPTSEPTPESTRDRTADHQSATPSGNPSNPVFKPDWEHAKKRHERWWRGEDLVLALTAPLDVPRQQLPDPGVHQDPEDKYISVPGRSLRYEYHMSQTGYFAEAVPVSWAMCVGPGDLAAMLGSDWHFSEQTVWYEPCITDPTTHPPLKLDRDSFAFRKLTEMTRADLAVSAGRYLTGIPDLIENIDILSAMRDPQTLLLDMFDHPQWIEDCMFAINQAYFEVFDHFYNLTKDPDGWSVFAAFAAAGPGKTAKVQCDACSMFGPDQFEQFVVPAMTEQCDWLDNSLYHLDGEECWPNLDLLLSIESLDAIEWTPKFAYSTEGGGHPKWYDLYRRIKAGGKAVQAITVKPNEVIPLLDAVGPQGMYVQCHAESESEAESLMQRVSSYYAK